MRKETETAFLRFWREMDRIVLGMGEAPPTVREADEAWRKCPLAVRESIYGRKPEAA